MIRKLCALAEGKIVPENGDSPEFHELLTPGHLLIMVLKVRSALSPSLLSLVAVASGSSVPSPSPCLRVACALPSVALHCLSLWSPFGFFRSS